MPCRADEPCVPASSPKSDLLAVNAQTLDQLQGHLSGALGPEIGVAVSNVSGNPQSLYPEEWRAVAKAVSKRQQEFAAGRHAARVAMRGIGLSDMAIPCNADRSPAWPTGLTGSISHSRSVCVVVVGREKDIEAIGIDIEEQIPIEHDLWPTICSQQELALMDRTNEAARGLMVTRIFSAKEAFYKWQYPQTKRFLDFHDVAIEIDTSRSAFMARCLVDQAPLSRLSRMNGNSLSLLDFFISIVKGRFSPSKEPI